VSRYQKGKTNLDFTEARDSEWQWHPLGHMQVCTSSQITTPVLHHSVFLQAGCPSCRPTNSDKALKAKSTHSPIKGNVLQHKINTHKKLKKKTKARFSRLLRHLAWKQSGSVLKGKGK